MKAAKDTKKVRPLLKSGARGSVSRSGFASQKACKKFEAPRNLNIAAGRRPALRGCHPVRRNLLVAARAGQHNNRVNRVKRFGGQINRHRAGILVVCHGQWRFRLRKQMGGER